MDTLQIKGFTVRVFSFDEVAAAVDHPEILPGMVRAQPDGCLHVFPKNCFPVRMRPGEFAVVWPDGDIITTTESAVNSIKSQGD